MTKPLTPAEQLLQAFHNRHAGATSQSLAHGRTESGLSSYEILASVVESAPPDAGILDLACGDGYLLKLVNTQRPDARLIGIDVSHAELQAAHARLAGCQPELIEASAQNLPLSDTSVDVVLCHMSLMLMEEVDQIVAEIWRVLRPGGVVAVIVSDGSSPAGAGKIFMRLVREAVDQFGGGLPRLGDNRTRSEEGLMSLFDRAAGFDARDRPQRLTLNLDAEAEQVWASLSLMYNFEALDEMGREYVRTRFFDSVRETANDAGLIPYRTSQIYASFTRI